MAQQIQELINKIKSEGLDAAKTTAQEIESQAQQKAKDIVAQAESEAQLILAKAKEENQKNKESTRMALQQAARDMLLSLRKEIEYVLGRLVSVKVSESLSSDQLSDFIKVAIKAFVSKNSQTQDVKVSLSVKDLERIKKGFISKLKDEIKKPITLQSTEDIGKGFTMSFDEGKSCFDFTDESLVEYIEAFVNQDVSELLKEAVASA